MTTLVKCELCPRGCLLDDGEAGDCRIRANIKGVLTALAYGHPCAVHIDPVEKKPMFHFYPGTTALSIATAGCNLHCLNCQNWEISQSDPVSIPAYRLPPAKVTELAEKKKCLSIAYTYSEPCVFYEYTMDTARKAKEKGIKNILVTAGYLNRKPMKELLKYLPSSVWGMLLKYYQHFHLLQDIPKSF